MQTPPLMTDRPALLRNRARADAGALFLHEEVLAEVEERLAEVNRAFTDVAVVTGFPALWARPGAVVLPDDEVLGLTPQGHDLVIHGLALHWANDLQRARKSDRKVPRPRLPRCTASRDSIWSEISCQTSGGR